MPAEGCSASGTIATRRRARRKALEEIARSQTRYTDSHPDIVAAKRCLPNNIREALDSGSQDGRAVSRIALPLIHHSSVFERHEKKGLPILSALQVTPARCRGGEFRKQAAIGIATAIRKANVSKRAEGF
jgi:hypothetical protein